MKDSFLNPFGQTKYKQTKNSGLKKFYRIRLTAPRLSGRRQNVDLFTNVLRCSQNAKLGLDG